MAFVTKNWSGNMCGIGMGGQKHHSYSAGADALATAAGAGYFNTVQADIASGDIVWVDTTNGGVAAKGYVATNTAGVITLAALS